MNEKDLIERLYEILYEMSERIDLVEDEILCLYYEIE